MLKVCNNDEDVLVFLLYELICILMISKETNRDNNR